MTLEELRCLPRASSLPQTFEPHHVSGNCCRSNKSNSSFFVAGAKKAVSWLLGSRQGMGVHIALSGEGFTGK